MKRRTLFGVLLAPIAAVACPAFKPKPNMAHVSEIGSWPPIDLREMERAYQEASAGGVPEGTLVYFHGTINVPNPRMSFRINSPGGIF